MGRKRTLEEAGICGNPVMDDEVDLGARVAQTGELLERSDDSLDPDKRKKQTKDQCAESPCK